MSTRMNVKEKKMKSRKKAGLILPHMDWVLLNLNLDSD